MDNLGGQNPPRGSGRPRNPTRGRLGSRDGRSMPRGQGSQPRGRHGHCQEDLGGDQIGHVPPLWGGTAEGEQSSTQRWGGPGPQPQQHPVQPQLYHRESLSSFCCIHRCGVRVLYCILNTKSKAFDQNLISQSGQGSINLDLIPYCVSLPSHYPILKLSQVIMI